MAADILQACVCHSAMTATMYHGVGMTFCLVQVASENTVANSVRPRFIINGISNPDRVLLDLIFGYGNENVRNVAGPSVFDSGGIRE